ncbi:MAG: hypothetical protein AB8B53_00745 [Flavobacteriales bacterium]
MNKLEQDIKNRLSQSASLEGIDSESLWSSISNAAPVQTPEKKRRFGFVWFLGAALLASCVYVAMSTQPAQKVAYTPREAGEIAQVELTSEQESNTVNTGSELALQRESSSNNYLLNSNHKATAIQTNAAEQRIEANERELLNDVKSYPTHGSNKTSIENSETRNTNFPNINDIDYYENERDALDYSENNSKEAKTVAFENQSNYIETDSAQNTLKKTDEPPVSELDAIAHALKVNRGEQDLTVPNEEYSDNISHLEKDEQLLEMTFRTGALTESTLTTKPCGTMNSTDFRKPLTFSLYAGTVLAQSKFSASEAELEESLNSSITPELGYRLGGALQLKEAKNWNLIAGLEYSQWNDRLDNVFNTDTMVTMNQELVPAVNIRTVRHYNKVSVLSIPVEFTLFKDTERLRFGLGLGASYSFVFGQEGRLLGAETPVIDYSQSNQRYSNFLSGRVTPSLGLKLSEKVMLNALCTFSFQGHGNTSFSNFKSSSVAIMPAVGVSIRF